jgi:hypothetical protein
MLRIADNHKFEPGQKNSISGNNPPEHSDDSDSSSNSSIPAVLPKATNEAATKRTTKATFAIVLHGVKRKRALSMDSGGGDHDDESDSSQSDNEGERGGVSGITFHNPPVRPSRKVHNASKRATAQSPGRNITSSAPPDMMSRGSGAGRDTNSSSARQSHTEGEDGDGSIYSGRGA